MKFHSGLKICVQYEKIQYLIYPSDRFTNLRGLKFLGYLGLMCNLAPGLLVNVPLTPKVALMDIDGVGEGEWCLERGRVFYT